MRYIVAFFLGVGFLSALPELPALNQLQQQEQVRQAEAKLTVTEAIKKKFSFTFTETVAVKGTNTATPDIAKMTVTPTLFVTP